MNTATVRARRPRCAPLARVLVACALVGLGSGAAHALDANTASADELRTIRGIGPATAARIVEARQREPFRDLDDLRSRVRGIGAKNLRRMQEAGLEVGSAHVVEGTGRAKVIEPAASKRDGGAARIERYVGRPR